MKRMVCLLLCLMLASVAFAREPMKGRHWKKPQMVDEENEVHEEYDEYVSDDDGQDEDEDEGEDDDGEEINIGPREEKIVFKFLSDSEPFRIIELKKLRSINPWEYQKAIRHILGEAKDMEELRRKDPKLFDQITVRRKLEHQSHVMADKIRHVKDKGKRAHLEEELKAILNKLFPLRCLELEKEIDELSHELKKAKMLLEKKKANKDKVIERRFRELTGAEDALAW